MASINQNLAVTLLPNFRNLGVMLRVLVIVTGLTVIAAMLKSANWSGFIQQWFGIAAVVQPIAVCSVLLLGAANAWLHKLEYRAAVILIVLMELAVTLLVSRFGAMILGTAMEDVERDAVFTVTTTLVLLGYFNLRNRALSPALTEARLQALQARIRPHFLFNSINAVLSLIRSEPQRAESALEDMADLFRGVMADNRDLIPLADEVALCRKYLNLESLRLGDRLNVKWFVENMPDDALVPPLILQPLIENAVYHGVQASNEPSEVSINIYQRRGELHAILANPVYPGGHSHSGNRMAIDNIRERLALHFDAEAGLSAKALRNLYQVHIHMPYRKQRPS